MKKYIGLTIAVALMLSFAVAVKAEESGVTNANGGRPVFNKDLQEKRDVFKDKTKENRDAFKQKMEIERKAFLDDLKTKKDAFMSELKTKKEEWKTAKSELRKKFCQGANEMIANRFKDAIDQLEKYQIKVSEIIDKLKADGKDTGLATEALNLSKQKLADAKAKLTEIKALVPEGGCENMTPEIWEKIKLGARDAKDLLKQSREALRQSVKEVKNLKGEDKNEANDDNGTQ